MPIINGQYVNDSLPGAREAQNQVFGEYSRRDMSDYSSAAYNYLMKQQEQAYNLQLWNLTNQYNSPAEQMRRYQDAGLNPNLIYGQQNIAQSPSSVSAPSFRSAGSMAKGAQNAINAIGQIMNTVKAARDTYDYMKYGREEHAWQRNLTMERSNAQAFENEWLSFLLGHSGSDSTVFNSPKANLFRYQVDTQAEQLARLKALVAMIPDEQERIRALKALDDQRLSQMKGQYDFILKGFDTGNQQLNGFLRMLMFFGLSNGL